ncbi:MAG TPA: FAD-dependent thymidylate synthase [Syntrophales bacterium]|nr:FAD-dependent thymidylate synthase [Syntrophales bacterium]
MDIRLAGYNVDAELLESLREALPEKMELTPETVSAAYARISRSPRTVGELRASARLEVEKARRSNRTIVFDMGHSSVAEHAVFNLDITGISRLVVEEVERFRLCSYMEKSQRYVLFRDDFVRPEEIIRAGLLEPYVDTIRAQQKLYAELYEALRPLIFERHADLAAEGKNRSLLEGWAKEDARYAIALATETQLGLTANARNLELMIRRLAASPLAEAADCSRRILEAVQPVAPSLIRYTEATEYDRLTREELRRQGDILAGQKAAEGRHRSRMREVSLVHATPDADTQTVAALLFASTRWPLARCAGEAERMGSDGREEWIRAALCRMQSHDAALREFEYPELVFELVVSASCFAQLKRHRMATLIAQDYDPSLGVTIPRAIREAGMEKRFLEVIRQTEKTYARIRKAAPAAAPYILTNAHRRRVCIKLNARELYHLARLRSDGHAQWDIRNISDRMLAQARKVMPLTLMLAAGKDGFSRTCEKAFGKSGGKGKRKEK